MTRDRLQLVWKVLIIGLFVALARTGAARADGLPHGTLFYLSAPGGGTVNGVAYADEDVLRYSPDESPHWTLHFDGSAAGLPAAADIDAYDYSFNAATFTGFHYMSFDRPVVVPGLGQVDDSDIVLYHTGLLGNTWSLFFDGSTYGLTTDAEDIDGLTMGNGTFMISTTGNFTVPAPNGTVYQGRDEDIVMWESAAYAFTWVKRGVDMGIPKANDFNNLSFAGGSMFYNLLKPAVVNGLSLEAHDVAAEQGTLDGADVAVMLDGGDVGLPKIDALDVYVP